ncbi:MAG: Rnase Y domain-containing protein, partial [Pseudobdellovibrionaceae bacterium]
MDLHFFIYLFVGLILGGVLGFLFFKLYRQQIIKKAQLEAEEIQAEIQEQTELRKLEEQEIIQELETELWTKSEKELLKSEEHISELQEIVDEKKQKVDQRLNELKTQISGKEEAVGTLDKKIRQIEKAFEDKKQNRLQLMKQLSETLCQQLNTTEKEVSKSLQDAWFEEARSEGQKYVERTEEEFKEHAEARAKGILDVALDRFARPYCPERGIGAVFFPDNNIRQIFCDPNKKNIEAVQNACGCDIVIEADSEMVGVAGFDPVRRELTRRTLEKIFREPRWINPTQIQKFAEQLKKDLLKQIRQDGDAIARELKVEQLHPEIKQMMGSLRYRYSFTQNQYFHCSEVGWLCGLLAGELNLNIAQARRSGMLHDIGKSMDHAMDGGHAVIGADFIQTR